MIIPENEKDKYLARMRSRVGDYRNRLRYRLQDRSNNTLTPYQLLNLLEKSDGICTYCKAFTELPKITFDHVIALRDGGKNCIENIVISCGKCNSQKDPGLGRLTKA